MNRVYHPYWLWEEWKMGMWRTALGKERDDLLIKAIEFTGDAKVYGEWMMKAVEAWPKSCEHNLSDVHINRQAWIGHAATCLALGCPEDITRLAWHHLTKEQQDEANAMADKAIAEWERMFEERQKCQSAQLGLTF